MTTRLTLFVFFCSLFTTSLRAEEWPGWRGPRGDGTSNEVNVPLEWSTTKNVAWKAAIPGVGHSSPIIYGDNVFLTSCREEEGHRIYRIYGQAGHEEEDGTDLSAVARGYIAVTPVHFDLTDREGMDAVAAYDLARLLQPAAAEIE